MAEQQVLGCCLSQPEESLAIMASRNIQPEAFFNINNKAVYVAMMEMGRNNKPISIVSLQGWLNENGSLEDVGGLAYLSGLCDLGWSASMLSLPLDTVMEKLALRKMGQTCVEFHHRAPETHNGETSNEILRIETEAARIREEILGRGESIQLAVEVGDRVIEWIEHRFKTSGQMSGIPTGFLDFDRMTDGLQFHEHAIIGARPSIGKTAIALDIIRHACIETENPIKALFITAEMTPLALGRRLAATLSRIPMINLRNGSLTEGNFKALASAMAKIKKAPIQFLDGTGGISAYEVAGRIKTAAKQGVKLVIIDYIQKIRPDSRHEKRTYEVAQVSGTLTSAARRTGVALLSLAQLSRENEKEKGRRPRLSDLSDSGQLERDADLVGLLHRDRAVAIGPAELYVAKQRDGETGMVNLSFLGNICRFENATTTP